MDQAEVKEMWLIVECPHCLRPQTLNKYVMSGNSIVNLNSNKHYTCKICERGFKVYLSMFEQDTTQGA